MPEVRWTLEVIRKGIDRFMLQNNASPTATDFDRLTIRLHQDKSNEASAA